MEQTLEDRWSPAFITHRLRHRGEWSLSLRWSVGQLPDPRAFLRNKRRVPSMFDIVIRIVTVVYIYIHIYILACVHVHYRGWQSLFTAIWSPRIWRVRRSRYHPYNNRYTRFKLQRVSLR